MNFVIFPENRTGGGTISATFWIILVVAGFAALFLLGWYVEKRRTDKLMALAAGLGFKFSKGGDDLTYGMLESFHLFSQGRRKTMSNIISGTANGIDLLIFDYRYTTGSGKHSHTWDQTVIQFMSSQLQLPEFALRPESVFHKIGNIFGFNDIDFPSNPVFSRRYLLKGSDEEAIRGVFTPALLAHFEQGSGLCVETGGCEMILYRTGKRVAPDKIVSFMEEGFGLFALVKRQGQT